jgi:6-phosphogluconolactonase
MKFSNYKGSQADGRRRGGLSQILLVSAIALVVASLLSACQLVTIDYILLAGISPKTGNGEVQALACDSQSGALRNAGTPSETGGTSPVAMAVSADYAHVYVADGDANSVTHFTIDSSGKLTKKDSVTLADKPVAIAINQANSYLYVVSGTASATLSEYALSSGAIGSLAAQQSLTIPGFAGDTAIGTGVAVMPSSKAVVATVFDQSSYNPGGIVTSSASPGWVYSYTVGAGGALAPSLGSPYRAGVKPSAVIIDPTGRYAYVTDFASNHLIGYSINDGSVLNFQISGPYKTGSEPSSLSIDPRGKFLYVSNALDSSVSSYSIDLATGVPSATVNVTGAQVNATDPEPLAIVVEPALGRYVYTANYLGGSISGFRLNPTTGVLENAQATPYPSESKPRAIVAIPHGNHSLQTLPQ